MKIKIFIFFMSIVTALAGTNVNISFTQEHSRSGSKMSELKNDQSHIEVTDFSKKYSNDDKNSRYARILVDDKKPKIEVDDSQKVFSDLKTNHAMADYRSERVQSERTDGFLGSHSQNQQRIFYNSNREVHQNHDQFINLSPQDKQNIEFERYIHSYHSGPTVETVYESANPKMQQTLPASPVQERSQRVVKFERQVALITKADSAHTLPDTIKPIVNHQTVTPTNTKSLGSKSSSTPSSPSSLSPEVPGLSVTSTAGNNFKVNLHQKPSLVGKDGFNFDLNYNKPNYNDPTFKYSDEHSDSHFYNQYPPSAEERQNGYDDYYNNIYSRQQVMEGYHPTEQRPVVTKTIQIAQPAIKAKKYELRHPAIQKEFYDIEERVVIKPAGTVVVELERPSAKILKEETTLPLGHPHPAVAAQYMQNRNSQTFRNIIYSKAGSTSANHPNNQYIPHQTYNNKNVQDHHSGTSSSVSPTYDNPAKDISAETNQNKPFTGESHYSASPSPDSSKLQSREIVVLTDDHGNQRQLSSNQFTFSRDETNISPSRTVYNNRNSYAHSQSNVAPQRPSYQSNHDDREDFTFDAEHISNSGDSKLRKEKKPARLQEAPSEIVIEQKQPQSIIKHEHKIVLSPTQHNIYLNRNQDVPKTKFIEENAQVREMNPYPQNNLGPVVVYAPAKQIPELKYVQRSDYKTPATQYHSTPQRSHVSGNHVQYSAPYAQMRHHTDQDQTQNEQQHQKYTSSQHKSENLILEEKPIAEELKSSKEKEAPQAHIEIKIPHMSSDNSNKAIFVSSTIRPMIMVAGSDEVNNSELKISVTNNGEPMKEKNFEEELDSNAEINNDDDNKNVREKDTEYSSDIKTNSDCDQIPKSESRDNYKLAPGSNQSRQPKFLRIVEASSAVSSSKDVASGTEAAAVQSNIQPQNVDVNVKSFSGNISPSGSRVIASTAAPKESSPSESFHKRRIVVNHPFQTVREVVEHEPYTNYHEVQVHEPATPALYHAANYYQSHGALRQSDTRHSPAYYS